MTDEPFELPAEAEVVKVGGMDLTELSVLDLAGMKWEGNPRTISPHDADALARSLERFGVLEPVIVNRSSGRVVGGHQRIDAAQAIGKPTLPVVLVNLPEGDEEAANVALNRISGDWDWERLAALLRGLQDGGFEDLSLTGFEEHELDPLLAADWNPPAPTPGGLDVDGGSRRRIDLSGEQITAFERVLALLQAGEDELPDDGVVVAMLCESWLEARRET